MLCVLSATAALAAGQPQTVTPDPVPKRLESPKVLALPPSSSPSFRRQTAGTGFFVDDEGHILTAAHVVEHCVRLVIAKEDFRMEARLIAASTRDDLALLKAPRTLGLAAVFPASAPVAKSDMVFAGAYDQLAGLMTGGGIITNARVTGNGEGGTLALDSPVKFGASGAPVLDRFGLVQGVISRRTSIDRVLAVGIGSVKAFLTAHGVGIVRDDRPQIAGSASRAHRASSISVRVTCLQG